MTLLYLLEVKTDSSASPERSSMKVHENTVLWGRPLLTAQALADTQKHLYVIF